MKIAFPKKKKKLENPLTIIFTCCWKLDDSSSNIRSLTVNRVYVYRQVLSKIVLCPKQVISESDICSCSLPLGSSDLPGEEHAPSSCHPFSLGPRTHVEETGTQPTASAQPPQGAQPIPAKSRSTGRPMSVKINTCCCKSGSFVTLPKLTNISYHLIYVSMSYIFIHFVPFLHIKRRGCRVSMFCTSSEFYLWINYFKFMRSTLP